MAEQEKEDGQGRDNPVHLGSVVRLKSGGQAMTVVKVNHDGTLACHWFEEGVLRMNLYRPECLTVVA